LLLTFWPSTALGGGSTVWLQGWLIIPAEVLWQNVTTLMRPGPMNWWRWTRVLLGYLLAVAAVVVETNTNLLLAPTASDPLYLNALRPGPLFPVFFGLLGLFTGMSLINLLRSARAAPAALPRKQLLTLAAATAVAGLAGPITVATTQLGLPVPRVVLSLLLGIGTILIGWGVARFSALIEGRIVGRDFVYNAVAIVLVTTLYLLVTWASVAAYRVPAAVFVFMLMLIVVTHTLVDVAGRGLDLLFYRRDVRRLRTNLRQLTRLAGEVESFDKILAEALGPICEAVDATFGLLLLFQSEGLKLAASYRWHAGGNLPLQPSDLAADDVQPLALGRYPAPLSEAVLLIPLYSEDQQLGALLLGRPLNGIAYSDADIDRVLDASDRLTAAIREVQREAEHLAELARLAEAGQPKAARRASEVSHKQVEDALRNLYNIPYLGETSLAGLKLVGSRLPAGAVTHVDRGKSVHSLLVEAIEKLRPSAGRPAMPPAREWHTYIILHDAYLEDQPNRDIMARLYISEGTFNRTRRGALRAVARSLEEMEAALD
jgi:hypothetical protein